MRTCPTYADADEDGNIPLKSREHFKFYEPLILLRALNDELKDSADYAGITEACDITDPKQLFEAYLNKLSLICDSAKGDYGAKVSAVWVSEDTPGRVCYHITSNQRHAGEQQEIVTIYHNAPESRRYGIYSAPTEQNHRLVDLVVDLAIQ